MREGGRPTTDDRPPPDENPPSPAPSRAVVGRRSSVVLPHASWATSERRSVDPVDVRRPVVRRGDETEIAAAHRRALAELDVAVGEDRVAAVVVEHVVV